MWDLIKGLRDAGVAVVLTTHYLEEAEQLADHVVIVDHGRTLASGRPQDLVSAAASATLRFTTEPGLDVTALQGRLPPASTVAETSPGTYLVTTDQLTDAITEVTSWCTQIGVAPTSINSEQRNLEDVFLDLTGDELRP